MSTPYFNTSAGCRTLYDKPTVPVNGPMPTVREWIDANVKWLAYGGENPCDIWPWSPFAESKRRLRARVSEKDEELATARMIRNDPYCPKNLSDDELRRIAGVLTNDTA